MHEGVLRRKKEDHGRFEDPYKTVCVCRLQGGVLRLKNSVNGEVVGDEERLDLRVCASLSFSVCLSVCLSLSLSLL